jgi:hypothetical protein
MAGGDSFCCSVLSADLCNLAFDVTIRQGQGNNTLDPDQAKLVAIMAFANMEDGLKAGNCKRLNLCIISNHQPTSISRYKQPSVTGSNGYQRLVI